MEKPALREPVRDRSFRSTLIRITDAAPGEAIKPLYSTIQGWNADESLLLLYAERAGVGSHQLYDGRSYRWRESLDLNTVDIEQVFWHPLDPDLLFTIDGEGRKLMRYSVSRGRFSLQHDFRNICGESGGLLTAGGDVQMPSWDGRRIGLRCAGGEDKPSVAIVYDIETDTVVGSGLTGPGDGEGHRYHAWTAPSVAPSGERTFFQGTVTDARLRAERELSMASASEHASMGMLPNGHDAWFAVGFDPARDRNRCDESIGALVAHDLQTGDCKVIIGPASGHGYPRSGTHLSALAYRNPGWVALSSVGEEERPGAGKVLKLFSQEIYLAYTDFDNPRVCRVAHHRSWGRDNPHLSVPYYAEPHVSISPTGTRLIFGSDWSGGESVDTYVVELPAYDNCR